MRLLAHWLEEATANESVDLLRTIALTHSELGGEIGREISSLIRADDLKALVGYSINYEDPRFENVEQIAQCRQALAFFSKLEHLEIGIDKREEALRKWWEAERHCKETNALFKARARGEFQFSSRVESIIPIVQRKIARVLGKIPKFDELQYRVGPGATTATRKMDANPRNKFQAGVQCSEDLFPFAKALLEEVPHLASLHSVLDRVDEDGEEWMSVPVEIHTGKLDFAAKNASIYRVTVTEPLLNTMFQLAIGDHLFSRLAKFGLNLRDQTVNQCLAMIGSLSGHLATLDLKSASDTIAVELVYAFFPLDWAHFLARGRSTKVTLPSGEVVTQAKFSSMGNGFTFPLESLLFWAITEAACKPGATVNVFGDDIVCPTEDVPLVREALTAFGFWVNDGKSYSKGPFRESCGKDFYRGIDIRPFYQKDWVSARTLFLLHNFYVRKGDSRSKLVLSWINPSLHLWGPDGYGDGHLLGDHPRRTKSSHSRNGYAGYLFDTFTVRPRRDVRPKQPGDYVFPSYAIYQRGSTPIIDFVDLSGKGDPKRILPFLRSHGPSGGSCISEPSTSIPEFTLDDGTSGKALSLPGDDGYKRIAIYTLG